MRRICIVLFGSAFGFVLCWIFLKLTSLRPFTSDLRFYDSIVCDNVRRLSSTSLVISSIARSVASPSSGQHTSRIAADTIFNLLTFLQRGASRRRNHEDDDYPNFNCSIFLSCLQRYFDSRIASAGRRRKQKYDLQF